MKWRVTERVDQIPVFSEDAPYQTYLIEEKAEEMSRRGEDVIVLTSNEITDDTPVYIKDAVKEALDHGQTQYPPLLGLTDLRRAIAEKLKTEGADYSEKEIMVTLGAQEGIFLTIQSLVTSGDDVIMFKPDYFFNFHIEYSGGHPVYVPLQKGQSFMLDAKILEEKITPKTKMICLDSPSNPVGRVYTEKELRAVSDLASEHDLYVLHDTANEKLVWDGRSNINILSLPGMRERGVNTCSVSKCYGMGGWRVGYVAAEEELIRKVAKLHNIINNVGPPTFVQSAAIALYRDLESKPVKDLLRLTEQRRDAAYERAKELPNVTCHKPEGGGVLLPDITHYEESSTKFANRLLAEAKVAVAPGSGYNAEGYVRIGFANPRIEEAMDRIQAWLLRQPPRQLRPA